MPDISDLADDVQALLGRRDLLLRQQQDWVAGTINGGPNGDGKYPLDDSRGNTFLVPCPASLVIYASDSANQVTAALATFNNTLNEVQNQLADLQGAQQSAYDAQAAQLAAAQSAKAARFSQSMYFPGDFVNGSEYFAEGNGQIATQDAAISFPLSGSFPTVDHIGVVYQTESNPESCNSFGSLGYIPGVPGTKIVITAKIRAITDNTSNANGTANGCGILPLDEDFSLLQYVTGTGLQNVRVIDGWQTVTFTYVVPYDNPAPYYRPTYFYNVGGNTPDPLHPSNEIQGNQQFQIAYFAVAYTTAIQAQSGTPDAGIADAPADGTLYGRKNQTWVAVPTSTGGGSGGGSGGAVAPPIDQRYITSTGSGTYAVPNGVTYLKVRIKAGGGGGQGSGGGGSGGDGGNTTFGPSGGTIITAGGGKNGGTRTGGSAAGGWKNMPGQDGAAGVGGYTFHPGGKGGGPYGGTALGSTDGSAGMYGSGGGGAGVDSGSGSGSGGGEGGEVELLYRTVDLNYVYNVGAGGSGGAAGTGGRAGGNGGNGYIIIEAY